jgi:hypothetical protein
MWDSCGSTRADKLQKLQNCAARVLTSSSYDTNADYLFEILGWKNLASQRKIAKAIMVYKSVNRLAPTLAQRFFRFGEREMRENARRERKNLW